MLGRARILVVEDEPLIALELVRTVEDAGGIVVAAVRTLLDALDHARYSEIDAALLDVRLPDGKSLSVAVTLTARRIPFLFCTADLEDLTQYSAWPEAPIIAKPYTPEVVIRTLAGLLSIQV